MLFSPSQVAGLCKSERACGANTHPEEGISNLWIRGLKREFCQLLLIEFVGDFDSSLRVHRDISPGPRFETPLRCDCVHCRLVQTVS
jgi:hypothetical protein